MQTKLSVTEYVRKLRSRLWAMHALRGVAAAAGAMSVALLGAAATSEPFLTSRAALFVAAIACSAGLVAFALMLRPMRAYAGDRVAKTFSAQSSGLESRVRSALAMIDAPAKFGSPELVNAHLEDVAGVLTKISQERLVPASRLAHPGAVIGIVLLLISSVLFTTDPRLIGFLHSLMAPTPVRTDGTRVAAVVSHLRVRLVYPSYLGREATTLVDPSVITAPRGTSVEVQVEPTLHAERGVLLLGTKKISLTPANGGALVARINAQQSASLKVQIESDGVRYEDSRARQLKVVIDGKPLVSIESPTSGTLVEPKDLLTLLFVASDDAGLTTVDLHVRMPDGNVQERRVWSAMDDGGPRTELRASTGFSASEFGAQEGDALQLWLEARDGDMISGPNLGKSAEITVEVASAGKRLASFVPRLQAAADAAVALLGDRLERDVPEDAAAAKGRFETLARTTRSFFALLDDVISSVLASEDKRALDLDQIRGVKRRNQRLLDAESALHGDSVRDVSPRRSADARSIDELERDVILLADLLAKAHVDEAGAIAQELRDLKTRIEELLGKLDKTHSPEAERELLAEIARAEKRLAELSQSLSRMATRVPSEFVNDEALKAPEAQSTLQDLESAVQKRDLSAAAKHLDALAKQIDELASQLSKGGIKMRESRFGPQDQAMAEARQKLDMVSAEQDRLAKRSSSMLQDALSRGDKSDELSERGKKLAPSADAIRNALGDLDRKAMPTWQGDAMDRARERLRDAHDALKQGDLAGAQRASQTARENLQAAANEMANDARMFPGPNGETARNAEIAQRAARDAEKLSQDVANAMPDVSGQMTPEDRARAQGDVEPQRKTRQATDELKNAFQNGPGGVPLSPDGVESLEQAQESMQRAEQALQNGRADEAAKQQADASEKLQKLAKKLSEQQQGGGQGEGDGQKEANGSQNASSEEPVRIPGADEFKGPKERRRKLLDAMREATPRGYEAAVQRYYQELLR